jgi:hypothetical protein
MAPMAGLRMGWLRGLVTGVAVTMVLVGAPPARGQTGPTSPPPQADMTPPPAAPPSAAGPIDPLRAPAPPVAPVYAVTDAPPVAISATPDNSPFYQRWWFWTAIGAFAVTAVVIIAASSGPNAPKTDFGNMPAF